VVLPTLPPYPVDYQSTATYYWPNIVENLTQISDPLHAGLDTWESEPASGPFGFDAALKLDGTQCVTDGKFKRSTDKCIENPIHCTKGLSFAVWEKVEHPMDIVNDPNNMDQFKKKYILSTGADYDEDVQKSVPGFAIYHHGMDLIAIVSTGEDVWELTVRGQLTNKTWQSIGIRWDWPNLDETVTLLPEERGGLELYVNLEKVGQSVLPVPRPGYNPGNGSAGSEVPGAWDVMPPLTIPAKDSAGNIVAGKYDGAPIMTFGCHYDQMEGGSMLPSPKFDHFHEASIDEVAIWTRRLDINKTHDETLYFLGGYVKELEDLSPEGFSELLKSVDMTDPDQAEAAGSMSAKLLSAPEKEDAPPVPTTTSNPEEIADGKAALESNPASQKLSWKETEKNKQLLLLNLYKGLLNTDGVKDGALPKHIDSRFSNIPIAAKLLSCKKENDVRWKIVQEDEDQPGSSELVQQLEHYALSYMGSSNISFYDDTQYFKANISEYVAHLKSEEMFMSVQKMNMQRLRFRGPVFNVHAYKEPYKDWNQARALWDNPRDEIRMPTDMWADNELCKSNPVTFLYAIYPCYSNYAPLRRNPVEITSRKFVLDSKVISVRMMVNNDTFDAESGEASHCVTDPQWMKYHPVQLRLYHKSKETARRKVLHHENEIKTSIDIRRCVIWNEEIGLNGAWDSKGCTTVMTEQDSTTCECDRFGTYALAAEKIEQPEAKDAFSWLIVSRYIGFVVSLISLTIFIAVICISKHLWEMFHLMRLNTGICYWFALFFHFISEAEAIQDDRHANAAISSLILFFYLCGSYFQFLEAFAEFRAITGGIIGGKTMAYIPIGWGSGFIGLGVTWFFYGHDVGTDPDVFIGWENETKMPFFYMNYVALWTGLALSAVVLFNASTPQTRKEDVVEDLQVQGQGLAITNFLFCMVWVFAYPAYIKFPGKEMRDFYPVFTLFNAWMGLIIFIFLGLSSKRFRFVLAKWWALRKGKPGKKYDKGPDDDKNLIIPIETPVESLAPSPSSSRPVSARTTTTVAPMDDPEDPVTSRPTSSKSLKDDPPNDDDMEEQPANDADTEDPPANDDDMEDIPANDDDMKDPPAADDDMEEDDDMD